MGIEPGMIAIDPGASGGIAWMDSEGAVNCTTLDEWQGRLYTLKAENGTHLICYLENPGFGGMKGFTNVAKLHRLTGKIEGYLQGLMIKSILVRPQEWQKALKLGTSKQYGKRWKAHLRDEAQRRFPGLHITLKTADALLILEYAGGAR